jgi:hypothetical protein
VKNNIVVEIDVPMEDTQVAMFVIDNVMSVNNLKMDISIAYDYDMEGLGMYFPNLKDQGYRVFVNPMNCKTQDDIDNNTWREPFCPGYTADLTLFGVTIHEFCHLLQYKAYPDIVIEYVKQFPTERFYLNDYSNNELFDELAELMTVYISNPYLLKLISKKHFNFCKSFFKSPMPCSLKKFRSIYNGFPIHVKEHMKKKWNLVYDHCQDIFVRSDDGKD